jgi:HAMP domain-containing protein
MKNLSIRTKMLSGLVIINLLGAVVMVVYLHQSFSSGLDVTATKAVAVSAGAWNDFTGHLGTPISSPQLVKDGQGLLDRLKAVTGGNSGLLLDKESLSASEYAALRAEAKLPDNWNEGNDVYVLAAVTDEALAPKMTIRVAPDTIPEAGKIVGVENGACTRTCHGNLRKAGDFWQVDWSNDGRSRTHAVFPVADAAGKPIGLVYTIDDITAQVDAAEASLFRTLWVVLGTLLVATLAIGWMLDVLVLRRLQRMTVEVQDLAVRVAGGDFEAKFEPEGTADEIGAFEQFFANFVDVMTGTVKSLTKK